MMIGMADKPAEILSRLQQYIPPKVDLADVLVLLDAYFAGSYTRTPSSGSHQYVISHVALRIADEWGMLTGCLGGRLTISVTDGNRKVKKWIVANILQAIEAKIAYDKINPEAGSK